LALVVVAAAGVELLRQAPLPPAALAQQPAISAGMVTIESDRQQADNRTGILTATGNVRITYPDRRMVATSRQAQYFSRQGVLVLTGDVDVIDAEGQRLRGERVVYRVDSERLQADPQAGRQVFSRFRLQQAPQAVPAAPAVKP
jgi:lipopolysaccharide export system protein LptA